MAAAVGRRARAENTNTAPLHPTPPRRTEQAALGPVGGDCHGLEAIQAQCAAVLADSHKGEGRGWAVALASIGVQGVRTLQQRIGCVAASPACRYERRGLGVGPHGGGNCSRQQTWAGGRVVRGCGTAGSRRRSSRSRSRKPRMQQQGTGQERQQEGQQEGGGRSNSSGWKHLRHSSSGSRLIRSTASQGLGHREQSFAGPPAGQVWRSGSHSAAPPPASPKTHRR